MKNIFVALLLLYISLYVVYAQQSSSSCSLILCNKVEKDNNNKTNIRGVFSGFNTSALNSTQYFSVYLIFRGYEANKAHVHYTKLVHVPSSKIILQTNKSSFILNGIDYSHTHTHNWEVDFKAQGLYYIAVYVNDTEVQRTYFSVED